MLTETQPITSVEPAKEADLLTVVQLQKAELKRKEREIKALKKALHLLSRTTGSSSDADGDSDHSEDTPMTLGSEADSDREEIPDPVFDGDLLYCSECLFELEVDLDAEVCLCNKCGVEHNWETYEHVFNRESYLEYNHAMNVDRSLVPRGDTPLRELEEVLGEELPFDLPEEYRPRESRKDEYLELLKRGATQSMCEKFHLEFSYESGIYAWADQDIFDEFAPSCMQSGDFWKIHLGRRVELDANDCDGSQFIMDLLEDALLFPLFGTKHKSDLGKWQTLENSPGVWVTQLATGPAELFDEDDLSTSSDDEFMDTDPAAEETCLFNEYDLSDDCQAPAEDRDVDMDDQSEVEYKHLCDCEHENMCLACMKNPDAGWGDSDIDELEGDGEEYDDDQTSFTSEKSAGDAHSSIPASDDSEASLFEALMQARPAPPPICTS